MHGAILVHKFLVTCGTDSTVEISHDNSLCTYVGSGWSATGSYRRYCNGRTSACTLTVNTSSIAYGKRECSIQIEGSGYINRSPQIPVRITSSAPGGWDPLPGTACDPCTNKKPDGSDYIHKESCDWKCAAEYTERLVLDLDGGIVTDSDGIDQTTCWWECDMEYYQYADPKYTIDGAPWVFEDIGCTTNQYSAWACKRGTTSPNISYYFFCKDCPYSPNHASLDSVLVEHELSFNYPHYDCVYMPCPDHHFGQGSECVPCPVNTQRPTGDASCSACPSWTHTFTSGQACIDCFVTPKTVDSCPPGTEQVSDGDTIDMYFVDQDKKYLQIDLFCKQNYACLPCKPGTYLLEGQCEECANAKYQPNSGSTTCFDCTADASSVGGSTSVAECRCDEGHEQAA